MQEEIQSEGEISLLGMIKTLWSKLWILVIVVIASGIFGGMFGYLRYHNIHYYGDSARYLIAANPDSDDDSIKINTQGQYTERVFDTITGLLKSEVFNRELIKDIDESIVFPDVANLDKNVERTYNLILNKVAASIKYEGDINTNQLKVTVSVLNDPDFAEKLLASVQKNVPEFISNCMNSKSDTDKASTKIALQPLSYPRNHLLNGGYAMRKTVLFAFVFAFAAGVIACVAIVLIDKSDNRLRDYENIPAKYGVPVLGVIPRIDIAEQIEKNPKKVSSRGW